MNKQIKNKRNIVPDIRFKILKGYLVARLDLIENNNIIFSSKTSAKINKNSNIQQIKKNLADILLLETEKLLKGDPNKPIYSRKLTEEEYMDVLLRTLKSRLKTKLTFKVINGSIMGIIKIGTKKKLLYTTDYSLKINGRNTKEVTKTILKVLTNRSREYIKNVLLSEQNKKFIK